MKVYIIILLIVPGKCLGSLEVFQNKLESDALEDNSLLLNCIKNIIEIQNIKSLLVIGRPEHFVNFDVSIISENITIKIYKRISG